MTINITDEMVERAAEAMWRTTRVGQGTEEQRAHYLIPEEGWRTEWWRVRARAALEAVAPLIEAAARAEEREAFDWRAFSRENRERCEAHNGFNHPLNGWSLAEWATATMGELGEAAGAIKEMLRSRDGVPGKGWTPEVQLQNLADELADTAIYLDLLAQAAGIDLSTAVREKFDRTSAKIGYPRAAAIRARGEAKPE